MKKIIISLLAACCLLPLAAQDHLNRELTLEKEYNPSLRDANKINHLPELATPAVPKTTVQFADYALPYAVSPYLIPFSPSPLFTELSKTNKRGYLNLGVSTLLDIDADLGYQILNTNKDYLSIYLSNRYSNQDVKFTEESRDGVTEGLMKLHDIWGGVNYKHYFNSLSFNLGGQYNHSSFNYYGIPDFSYYGENLHPDQKADFLNLYTGIQAHEGAELFYRLNLNYTTFKYKHTIPDIQDGHRENRFIVDGTLQKQFNSTWQIGVSLAFKNYAYSISDYYFSYPVTPWTEMPEEREPGLLYNTPEEFSHLGYYKDYSLLSFNPYLRAEGTNWNLRLGITPALRFRDGSKFYISPDIHFSFTPTQVFQLYIDAAGGVNDNSLYNSFHENRYASPRYRIRDSWSPVDATVGFKLSPVPGLMFDLFGGYKVLKDEHFYVPYYYQSTNTKQNSTFTPMHYDADIFKLGAHIQYKYKDVFNLGLRGTYYNWSMDDDNNDGLAAWGKPSFVLEGNAGYNVAAIPLSFALTYRLESGRKHYPGTEYNLKNINDLSLRGNYAFNDSFSVFVSANNLLFQKYDLWQGYPAQSFNLMGGISLKF